jgi:intracellular sulfur oxidation DsrE/DsrF family protein
MARRNSIVSKAIAAALVFTLGTLLGLAIQPQGKNLHPQSWLASNAIQPAVNEYKHIVLHVSTSNQARLEQALDDAEVLLASYEDEPEQVRLEVVANSEGLSLLRLETSLHVDRIRAMVQKHRNVSFLACSRTIEKLRLKGIDVHLIPEAMVIPGALEQIVDRLQQGWVYIRV